MTFNTLAQIKEANENAGYHFFDPETIAFFQSRILPGIMAGRYFVTSEQQVGEERRFTLRRAEDNGSINTVGEFQQYATASAARKAVPS